MWGSLRDSKTLWVTWTFSFLLLLLVYHETNGKKRVAKASLAKMGYVIWQVSCYPLGIPGRPAAGAFTDREDGEWFLF